MSASWLRTSGLMIVLACLAAGCSGPKKIAVGGACILNSDCNQPLVCTMGKCHDACHTSADCPAGQSCITATDQSRVCQLPVETHCLYASDCQAPLTCAVDQRCHNQCQGDVDCPSGQTCTTTKTCAEPSQVDVNNNLIGTDGGVSGSGGTSGAGGTGSCPMGAETCSCYPNDTCNAGLTCASHLCVSLGAGGASGTGGSISASPDASLDLPADVPRGTAGVTSTGGTIGSGDAPGTGGSITRTPDAFPDLPAEAPVSIVGGTTTSGGTSASGGTTASGGSTVLGGSPSSGGVTSTGSATTSGGTTAMGGTTTSGGTTASGGSGGFGSGGVGGTMTGDAGLLAAETASFHCFNWADPGDNFQTGVLQPTGLSSTDDYATVVAKSNAILSGFQTVLGANAVRIPINETTVNTATTWAAYKGIFDAAISQNMKVIVAYWLPPGSTHIANTTTWNAMWKVVVDAYVANDFVYFDVFNEPSGYSATAFITLVQTWMTTFPTVPANRVIVAGTTVDLDVNQQGAALPNCLLSLHIYDNVGNTVAAAQAALVTHAGPYYSRTIVTEYRGASLFMQGITTQMKAYGMGSCYWAGLEGSNSMSIAQLNGTAPNYTLTVNDASTLAIIQSGWTQ